MEMAEQEKWKWQESGTTWKEIGLYHITLTITDRRPLLGTFVIPENDPCRAMVRRAALGNALVNCLLSIPHHHPEVQVLHYCLMPDHLHAVLYVRRVLILSPWSHDGGKRHLSRSHCMALNAMAEEFSLSCVSSAGA